MSDHAAPKSRPTPTAREERGFRIAAAFLLCFSLLRGFYTILPACFDTARPHGGSLRPHTLGATRVEAAVVSLVPGVGDPLAAEIARLLRRLGEIPADLHVLESIPGVGPHLRAQLEREIRKPPLQRRE